MTEIDARPLAGKAALVTGAGRGIGRALAERLASLGATVLCVSRTQPQLNETVKSAVPRAFSLAVDLSTPSAADRIIDALPGKNYGLDILVHCAGIMAAGTIEQVHMTRFDQAIAINLRSPYALTQLALPLLKLSQGQVLFINSSVIRAANTAGRGVHAAVQSALKAIADSLRDEVNPYGIRVISLMPGRTATAREQLRCELEGLPYEPKLLLQPEDVARVACDALLLPRTAEPTDLFVRPMKKPRILQDGLRRRAEVIT